MVASPIMKLPLVDTKNPEMAGNWVLRDYTNTVN
jgi:hypothetical protein